jgi:hypothetical protein
MSQFENFSMLRQVTLGEMSQLTVNTDSHNGSTGALIFLARHKPLCLAYAPPWQTLTKNWNVSNHDG